MKKKILLIIVALMPMLANAYDAYINGIYYNFSGNEAEVTYGKTTSNSYYGAISIPKDVYNNGKTYSVTSIGSSAFYQCKDLTSISIPESVISIDYRAFYGCKRLNRITIPNSVTSIGQYAFWDCTSLVSVTFSSGITDINMGTFKNCSSLTSITIPENVTSIGEEAFGNCSGLTSVTIPGSVQTLAGTIGSGGAFSNCSNLTTVIFGDGMTNTGKYTFLNCPNLTSVFIPESVTSIEEGTFKGCTGLNSIAIPNSVTSINARSFSDCSGLKTISIPNSVTAIGGSAFANCSSLKSISIPNSVTTINNSAFYKCTSLKSITIPNTLRSIGEGVFSSCTKLTSVTIEDGVLDIGTNTFSGCSALTSVTIPGSVVSIGQEVFKNCTGLTSVTIVNGVMSINGFYGCTGLQEIAIPNSVTAIGSDAFRNCSGLQEITIPNSVTAIGSSAFKGCSGLTSINIPNSVTSIGGNAFGGCSNLNSITIPNSVTSIGDGAFHGTACYNNQPDGLVYIGNVAYRYKGTAPIGTHIAINEGTSLIADFAFNGCNMGSVTIPNSVTSIGNAAFSVCSYLTTITIPNSVTSIGSAAFQSCSSLTSVTISNNVRYIGVRAFEDTPWINNQADGMVYIGRIAYKYKGTMPEGTLIDIIEGTLGIAGGAFQYCYGPSSISITIPESVTNIGSYAFNKCSIFSITFGDNIVEIGENAFDGQKIYVNNGTLTSLALLTHNAKNIFDKETGRQLTSLFEVSPTSAKNSFHPGGGFQFVSQSWKLNRDNIEQYTSDTGIFTGLVPDCAYLLNYSLKISNSAGQVYTFTKINEEVKTSALTLTTLQPKVISEGDVILAAQSNLDDEETNVGFEWRRTDWPDDFESKSGVAYIYEGMMEGFIRSINSNYLWKFRPYYTSKAGNTYYGEWKGLDPSDYSYFEPTVHTYSTINVNGNSAEVKGYAMRGTDKVTSQGFMYWKNDSSYSLRKKIASIPSDAMTVIASGNIMTATLEDLDYESTYCCVAFVTTEEDETFFGEVQTFSTNGTDTGEEVVDDTYINGIYYNFLESSAEVIRGDNVYSGSVVIPDSVSYRGKTYNVTSIVESAFYRCQDLTSVSIPGSVNTIGEQAFLGCNKLTSINLPNGLTSIGGYAFCECSALTSVTIPNSVTHIGKSAFLGCFSLTYVALPNSVTDIGESVFSSCRSLTSINIPNSVTSISGNAFSYCTGLTSVTIGSNVTSIGNYAFAACESLKDVYCDAEKVPNAYSDTFFDTDVSQATLHVPGMCKEAYRTTSPWNQFGTIVSSSDEEPTITGMQLDNSSFDEWSIVSGSSGKDLYQPWGEGKTPYWDTYNTFATTFSVSNSTYTDEDGRRYANLQTKYLVVKLVAGAIFTGSYLEVDGTNSVLSLGRPFTERPTKMKFDFQYHSSTINRTGGTWKDAWGNYVSQSVYESLKGQPDSCQIYIALGDWEPVDYVDKSGVTHTCPYLICTRPSQLHLFNPNDPHIIGYAQMTCGKDISSWTTETLDIHYRSDRTPKYIIVYATSSKYGDFSTGGEMSELKLDNIELLYGSIPDIDPEPVDSIPGDGRTFVEKLANGVEMEFKVVSKEGKTCQVGSGTSNCIDPDTTGEITIPSEVRGLNVVAIGDNAFNQCNDLSSVTLPNSITNIGQHAFYGCKLHNILVKGEIPPDIKENAFTNQTFYHAMLYIPTGSWDAYAYDENWYRFINIRETAISEEQLSMQQAYTLMDASTFTYSVYDPVNNCIGTISSVSGINEDNPNHSWQVIEAGGARYLYNIGAKKYVRRSGNGLDLTETPEPIEVEDGDNGIILGAQATHQWALVSNEHMNVAQNAIDEVTAIVSPIGEKGEDAIYNLAGQRIHTPQKGLNIINGKKVMIR